MSQEQQKLSASKLPQYRLDQLQINNVCPICNQVISIDQAVADHDHKTGRHRAILHRSCNSFISRLENSWKRYGISPKQFEIICPIVWEYINKDYSHQPLHHTYKPKPIRKPRQPRKPVK